MKIEFLVAASMLFAVCGCSSSGEESAEETRDRKAQAAPIDLPVWACEKGSAESCRRAGQMYENGDGTTADIDAARRYYHAACRLKDGEGCLLLGFAWDPGLEVDGRERYPQPLERGGKSFLLVDLNPGEDYRIILVNRSEKPVYCALFIDGACAIDRVVVEPGDLETRDQNL